MAAVASTTDGSKRPATKTAESDRRRRARYGAINSALARRAVDCRSCYEGLDDEGAITELDPREIFTRRQLETRREIGLYSDEDCAAGLAKIEGSPSELQKMLMRLDEAEDADTEASRAEGDSERALCETSPTTRAGALRLLRHLANFLDEDDVVNDLPDYAVASAGLL